MTAEQGIDFVVSSIIPLLLFWAGWCAMTDYKLSKEAKKLGIPYKEYKLQLKLIKLKNGGKEVV